MRTAFEQPRGCQKPHPRSGSRLADGTSARLAQWADAGLLARVKTATISQPSCSSAALKVANIDYKMKPFDVVALSVSLAAARNMDMALLTGNGLPTALELKCGAGRDAGLLARYRGTEVDTAGHGFFATFDGPARAVRCARAIIDALQPLGLDVPAGIHTGEVETIDGKTGGLAVNIGARVAASAAPRELLVSSTVKDLTAGSGLEFEDAGHHELKGIPETWHLFRVVDEAT